MNSENWLLRALSGLAARIVVVSPDLRLLAAAGKDMDVPASAIDGRPCYEILAHRRTPCRPCEAMETIRAMGPSSRLVEGRGSMMGTRVLRRTAPIFKGKQIEAVAIMDVELPEEPDTPLELSTADKFLTNLIMSSPDAVIASDMAGRILMFNEDASKITGYTREEALRQLDIRALYSGDGAREAMRRIRSESHGGRGKLKGFRVDLRSKDGTAVPIELSAAAIYDRGKEVATVGFFHDLRSRLRMEGQLQSAQKQLIQAEKLGSLGQMAAGVAHQLNNPLGGIVIYSQLLKEEYDLEPAALQDLDRIIEDASRCQKIVSELLDFARQRTLEILPNDLNQAVSRTIFLLENQPFLKEIEIVRELAPDLPLVPCDLQQINHVLMNIILNAVDSMEGHGRLTLATSLGKDGLAVRVEISDTGPGIPDEVLPYIFDPFFTTKEEGKGTGLGLSVAYGIIKNHRGRLSASSRPGEGATFVMELPVHSDEQPGGSPDGND